MIFDTQFDKFLIDEELEQETGNSGGGGGTSIPNTEIPITDASDGTWKDCATGLRHIGTPPTNWILTPEGCYRPILTITDPIPINLEDVLQILPDPTEVIERSYIIGSGVALSPRRLLFFNRAVNMSLLIDLSASSPVSFKTITGENISSFELASRTQRQLDICFTTTELDTADEGLNRAIATIQINAGTITLIGGNDQIIVGGDWDPAGFIDPYIQPPQPPIVDPPIVDPPIVIPPFVVSLTIVDTEQPSMLINGVRAGKVHLWAGLRGDTPVFYNYTWNFDVLGQGSGIGSASQATTATWVMTENDLRLLESEGKTSRTVEVVARKGNSIYRSTKEIILQDSMLGSVIEVNIDEQTTEPNTGPVSPPPSVIEPRTITRGGRTRTF